MVPRLPGPAALPPASARPGPLPPGVAETGRAPGPGRWERIALGRASAVFEPKPPPADPYRPDTVFDGWSTPEITVRLASVRGDEHRFSGRPRQDDITVAVHEPSRAVVFAVADGVSQAVYSHVGAALACRTAVSDVLHQLDENRDLDWRRTVEVAAYQLAMRMSRGAKPTADHQQEAQRQLATTLVVGMASVIEGGGLYVELVQVGDTAAWELREGRYRPLLPGKDNGSEGVFSAAVVALPWVPSSLEPVRCDLPPDAALLVGTDGFGDPLGDGSGQVGQLMAGELGTPPRDPRTLAHLLDFSRETFDDDRTLLAVWPRHRLDGPRG